MPRTSTRRVGGIALVSSLIWATSIAAQTPPPYPLAPEYDPGADRHFVLPTGRVGPGGTGAAGMGGLLEPSLATPFVNVSPLPRVSVGATTALVPGLLDRVPVFGAVTVQPVRYGPLDGSVTVVGASSLGGNANITLAAVLGSLSYGTDVFRVTAASGSLGGLAAGHRFGAVGIDAEIDRGEPSVAVVAGEPRTVRRRVKLIGEVYFAGGDASDGAVGLLGLRFSEPGYWVNLGVPFVVGGGGASTVWLPIASFGVAF